VRVDAERALLFRLAHVALVTSARGVRATRLVSITAACALLISACGLDFDKYAPQGEGDAGGSGQDAAPGGDATSGDSSAPTEAGVDAVAAADASADVAADTSEPPEASVPDASEASVTDYTVGGTISGLVGHGLQLTNAGNALTPASGATKFTFPAQPDGSAYDVTVTTPPSMPSQTCAVGSGMGNVAGANVVNVTLTCTPGCAPACNDGQMCVDGTDCSSASCKAGTCAAPACAPTCPDGNVCGGNGDCGSAMCTGGKCHAPLCAPGCNDGNACGANTDCASQVCAMGKCQAPACAPMCATGKPCGANGDCKSGMCNFNHTCR
jgi:hypothetical protein